MNHSRLHFFLFSLMSLVATSVFADETKAILPEKEEDIPVEFIPTLDTTISVGVRRLGNGPRVRFTNLGSIAQPITGDSRAVGSSFTNHRYTDGYVVADALGDYEKNAAGTQLTDGSSYSNTNWIATRTGDVVTVYTAINTAATVWDSTLNKYVLLTNSDGTYVPNSTPVLNSDGTIVQTNTLTWASTAKFIAYDANRARTWGVMNQRQIFRDGTDSNGKPIYKAKMNADGVISAGASLEADSSASTGFDISVERRLGKRGRLEWGVTAGFEFAYINAKASGVFPAFLLRTTDIYTLASGFNGNRDEMTIDRTQPGGNAGNLNFQTMDGTQVYRYTDASTLPVGYATGGDASQATPINLQSVQWGNPTVAGVVMIHGNYQIKGAYLIGRVGPSFRYNFNDRWAVSGTAGLALAWSGTNFRAAEYYNTWNDLPPDLKPYYQDNTTEYHLSLSNATHKFTPGLYCDLNLEYWVTDRTGFFAGVTGQYIRKYNQSRVGDWKDQNEQLRPGVAATVEMGKNTGWTLGIRTRF